MGLDLWVVVFNFGLGVLLDVLVLEVVVEIFVFVYSRCVIDIYDLSRKWSMIFIYWKNFIKKLKCMCMCVRVCKDKNKNNKN